MRAQRVPWQLKFLALALVWGSSFLLMKVGLEAMAGVQVAALRVLCGAGVLLALLHAAGGRLPRKGRTWGHVLVSGTLLCSLPWTLFAVGEERVSSAVAGIANAATPMATVLASMLLLPGEPVGRRRVTGVAVGFAGVLLILQPWTLSGGPDPVGFVMVLTAAASYGLGWAYVRKYLASVDIGGLSLPTAQVLVALAQMPLLLLAWWLVAGRAVATPWSLHTSEGALVPLLAVVALGVVGTGLAQSMQFDVVRAAGPTVATSVTYLIPIVSVLLGVLVLGERVGAVVLLGAGVVIGAALLIGGRVPRRARRAPSGPEREDRVAAPIG